MKTETERIADQVRRSYAGGAWHGPSVSESLRGVDASSASKRVLPGIHTIAELAWHLEYIQRVVLDRVEGRGRLTTDEEGWPPVPDPLTEADWAAHLRRMKDGAAALERAILAFPVERLDEPLVQGGSSASNNMLGHAQHNVYHAGQIMVMKKVGRIGEPHS